MTNQKMDAATTTARAAMVRGSRNVTTIAVATAAVLAFAVLGLQVGNRTTSALTVSTGNGSAVVVADGVLDPTFDGDGLATAGFGNGDEGFARSALQSDGKLVVAGNSRHGNDQMFGLARYNTDGSLDTSFGNGGIVSTNIDLDVVGAQAEVPAAVFIRPNNKIITIGQSSGGRVALVQYNADGSLDSDFDGDGKVTTTVPEFSGITAGALQDDGKIVAGGTVGPTATSDFLLVRYNADGTLDAEFGTGGIVTSPIGTARDGLNALTIQPDGKILAGGFVQVGSNRSYALARFNTDGSLDTSFGTNGTVIHTAGTGTVGVDTINGLRLQPDGRILAAGTALVGSSNQRNFTVSRYLMNGSLDTSFDGDGTAFAEFPSTNSSANAISLVVQPDGRIIAAGSVLSSGSGNDLNFALARFNSDGSLDTSFDGDGFATPIIATGHENFTESAFDVNIRLDGRIVISGSARVLGNEGVSNGVLNLHPDFAVAQLQANGALDPAFDGDGRVTTDIGNGRAEVAAVALQPDGKVLAAGETARGSIGLGFGNEMGVARFNSDGTLDTSFGGDGKVSVLVGTFRAQATAVAVQSDGKIVVGGFSNVSDVVAHFALVRFNPDGTLDTTFDGDGKIITVFFTNRNSRIRSIVIQPDGKILAAGVASVSGTGDDFAVARYNPDGTLDTTFDSDGKVTMPIGTGTAADDGNSMVLQPDGKIVVGGQTMFVDFALARFNPDGSPDLTFACDGKITTDIEGTDSVRALALHADGRIVAAGYTGGGAVEKFALVRYNPDGTLDTSFDDDGKVITAVDPGGSQARSLIVQPDGKIVAAGSIFQSILSPAGVAVVRYGPTGVLDPTFSDDGIMTFDFGGFEDSASAMVRDGEGRLVIGGRGRGLFGVARILASSAPAAAEPAHQYSARPDGTGCITPSPTPTPSASPTPTPPPTPTPTPGPSPTPGETDYDFDGDGRADLSVFRPMPDPAANFWYIRRSTDTVMYATEWGIETDNLAPADYDGDGRTDIAVWREEPGDPDRATFYILQSSNGQFRIEQFGRTGDTHSVVGDWDGDDKADLAVYRETGGQGQFFYRPSTQPGVDFITVNWGTAGDKPVRGDFDGDGRLDAAVFRPATGIWYILQSSNAQALYEHWGAEADRLVPADYDGDGAADLCVFRDGIWFIRQSSNGQPRYHAFGLASDTLVPADYDGDGSTDVAVYRNGVWYVDQSSTGLSVTTFGTATDQPIPSAGD